MTASEIENLVAQANAAQGRGQLVEAERLVRAILEQDPGNVSAKVIQGIVLTKSNRTEQAVATFKDVLERQPTSFDAAFWLSMLSRKQGDLKSAAEYAALAAEIQPNEAHAHSNLGLTLLAAQDLTGATESFQRAAHLNPRLAPNFHHLGRALQLQGRDKEAADAYRKAIQLAPNAFDSILSLGQSLMSQNDVDGAVEMARRALQINPNSATALLLLAGALIEENRTAEAENYLLKAIALDPRESSAHAMLGMRMQSLGRLKEANEAFEKSIEIQPKQGFAYCALLRNQKVTDRERIQKLATLVDDPSIPPRGLSFLHFGLGKAYEDLKEYELAMRHFDEANRLAYKLKFGDQVFDRKRYKDAVDWTIDTFTPEFFRKYESAASPSDLPIFILGMMRSGTTLVEQILSSHPDVEATGEQSFWMTRGPEALPVHTRMLNIAGLKGLAAEYLKILKSVNANVPHLTDKMPGNYIVLGLIHAAFPRAKVIHTRRDPRDTCISIYSTPNRVPNDWANDRANIVYAYQQYERLMTHWRAVLPADTMLEVTYEDIVDDRESKTREMVAFCGLEWNDACLRPEDNERSVVTPSVWQVRQPVYRTSLERWRNYEPWLGDFADL